MKLFSAAPAATLGYEFLTKLYYYDLPRDGLILCNLYQYEGIFCGFSVFTHRPKTFIQEGQRRHFFKLVRLVFKSLASNPIRLRAVMNVKKQDRWRRHEPNDPMVGELMTFGVLEQYR